MDVEYCVKEFVVTPDVQDKLKQAEAEGWLVNPDKPPVITYHLVRLRKSEVEEPKPPLPDSLLGVLTINEDLIMVFDKDGNRKS